MKTLIAGFGLALLGSQVVACADAEGDTEECLPGDIDCAEAGGGGKEDAFGGANDPAKMSQRLNYRLAELPKSGKRTKPAWKDTHPAAVGKAPVAWADTYWPTIEGGHNTRFQGASEKSPIEKYDAAFNNAPGCATQPSSTFGATAKAEWDTYLQCAGPATKWQSEEFQSAGETHDGIDNDNDGKTDELGPDGNVDGMATWWGSCHAWAPASLMLPEPQKSVTHNGVTFSVGDIKALMQNMFDRTGAIMVGGRCNAKEIKHDPTISANDPCSDLNPGALHVVVTNFLGINNLPLVEDRTANFEIWNQAVMGYEVTKQAEISNTKANECVGAAASNKWSYNTSAKKLMEVRMTVDYLTESGAEAGPVGFEDNLRQDDYHYILELNDLGKVIGGRYCTDSSNDHVDFLWAPTGSFSPSNPSVSASRVKELLAKAFQDGGTGGPEKVFTSTGTASIPDNSATGASVDVAVTGLTGKQSLAVTVDIKHTFSGDLTVELLRDGTSVKVLRRNAGGSTPNISETFALSANEVGAVLNGKYTLKVVDNAAQDVGTINSVKLAFTAAL
ncbi:MAG: proprotein convertase P-domain-containing protein [Deltaproteobacteria bacterium]|nr:proprotein convertase P-domain-containing protein [Deltaproteobacteria bacterium]